MRVHWLQHAEHDGPGTLAPALEALGHHVRGTRLDLGEPLPALEAFDALAILGGPMNIHQHAAHPWLVAEKSLIRAALATDKRLFGICLGAQLLADALGARVQRAPARERGWWPVTKTTAGQHSPLLAGIPDPFTAFHWHEDTFELPAGAVCLARSAACAQQAFSFDGTRVFGMQFHPEITADAARCWLDGDDWSVGNYVQGPTDITGNNAAFLSTQTLMAQLAQGFFGAAHR